MNPSETHVTLRQLIDFQAWWNYESKNMGWKNTMESQSAIWSLSQTLDNNYLTVIADLLRMIFQANSKTLLSDIYLQSDKGVLKMPYPFDTLFTDAEIRDAYANLIGGLGGSKQ